MKTLFAFCVFFLLAGSRFSDGAIAAGIFRSVHAVDLLFPVLLLCCARQLRATVASMPSTVHGLWLLWLAYCVTFAQLGHFVTGLAIEGEPLIVSLLFAAKELEFYVLMMFAAMVASLHPRFATRVCWTILVGLAIWIPIDLLAPSGYYLLGLPLEKGAIQTGIVYGLCSLFAIDLLLNQVAASRTQVLASMLIVLMLVAGMLLSLSRTAVLGFVAAAGVLCLMAPLRVLVAVGFLLAILLLAAALAVPDSAIDAYDLVFGRWGDASEHSGYRFSKWLELWDYLVEHPVLFLFGAGFDSPNALVYGRDLGHILAVDNAYIRRLFEVGALGFAVYAALLSSIAIGLMRHRATRHGVSLLVFFLFSGITAETPQITQSAGLYFLLTGTLFGLLAHDKGCPPSAR